MHPRFIDWLLYQTFAIFPLYICWGTDQKQVLSSKSVSDPLSLRLRKCNIKWSGPIEQVWYYLSLAIKVHMHRTDFPSWKSVAESTSKFCTLRADFRCRVYKYCGGFLFNGSNLNFGCPMENLRQEVMCYYLFYFSALRILNLRRSLLCELCH